MRFTDCSKMVKHLSAIALKCNVDNVRIVPRLYDNTYNVTIFNHNTGEIYMVQHLNHDSYKSMCEFIKTK